MLLRKQDELRELEEDLKYSDDEHDNEEKKQRLISRDVDDAKGGERIQLLEKIEAKFNEYGMCFLNFCAVINLLNFNSNTPMPRTAASGS